MARGSKGEEDLLKSCYRTSLQLAKAHEIKSIAFPNISTGVYGYPKMEVARVAVDEVQNFFKTDDFIEKVTFICFDQENYDLKHKMKICV